MIEENYTKEKAVNVQMSNQKNPQDIFSSVSLLNEGGEYPALIVCEHASNYIPSQFHNLGLSSREIQSHVAWDLGAGEVALHLSKLMDAPFVTGEVSRLVYDCNRPPEAIDAMPKQSEVYSIPGNENLDSIERMRRVEQVYLPFKDCIRETIAEAKNLKALITIHSFTPTFNGKNREVEIGILHDDDTRLADAMLGLADNHTQFVTRRNEPYGPQDGVTHTLRKHGVSNNLLNVMIEIRNDLITTGEQCGAMAKMLHGLIMESMAQVDDQPEKRRQA